MTLQQELGPKSTEEGSLLSWTSLDDTLQPKRFPQQTEKCRQVIFFPRKRKGNRVVRAWPGMERRVRPVQPCSDCSARAWSGEMGSMPRVQPVRTGRLPTGPPPIRPLTPADHRQHGRRESSVVLEQPRKCWGGTALPFPAPWVLSGGAGSGPRAPAGRSSAPPLPPGSASCPADPLHPAVPPLLRSQSPGVGCGQRVWPAEGRMQTVEVLAEWVTTASRRTEVRPGGASEGFSRGRTGRGDGAEV